MKNVTNILLGLILTFLVLIFYFQTFSRIRYETKIVSFTDSYIILRLDQESRNGWQIVGSRRVIDSDKESMYEVILQRKIVSNILIN